MRCSCATPRSVRRRTRSTRPGRTGGSHRSIRTGRRLDGHAYSPRLPRRALPVRPGPAHRPRDGPAPAVVHPARRRRVRRARTSATRARNSGRRSASRRTGTAARSSARTSEPFRRRRTAPCTTTARSGCGCCSSRRRRRRPRRHRPRRSSRASTPTTSLHSPRGGPRSRRRSGTPSSTRCVRTACSSRSDEPDAAAALAAIYRWLGASDAPIVVAALEDLWLETEPQNRPGTPSDENFRHRGTYGFDDLDDRRGARRLVDPTRLLRQARRRARRARDRARSDDLTRREDVTDMTTLTADDLHLFNEGRHFRLYERLGAHLDGDGVRFTVWAPNARAVSLLGAGNGWTHGSDALEPVGSSGLWTGRFRGLGYGRGVQVLDREPAGRTRGEGRSVRVPRGGPAAYRVDRRRPRATSGTTTAGCNGAARGNGSTRRCRSTSSTSVRGPDATTGPSSRTARSHRSSSAYLRDTGFTHVELLPIMEHPVLRLVGVPDHGVLRPDVALRVADRLHGVRRRAARRRHRRDPRLGAVALPQRRARARAVRRDAPLRARRPAAGLPPRLEHARLQLRPQRGAFVPDEQRVLLARPLPRRRPARRRGRVDALPRLLARNRASGSRTSSAVARTSRRSASCAR